MVVTFGDAVRSWPNGNLSVLVIDRWAVRQGTVQSDFYTMQIHEELL